MYALRRGRFFAQRDPRRCVLPVGPVGAADQQHVPAQRHPQQVAAALGQRSVPAIRPFVIARRSGDRRVVSGQFLPLLPQLREPGVERSGDGVVPLQGKLAATKPLPYRLRSLLRFGDLSIKRTGNLSGSSRSRLDLGGVSRVAEDRQDQVAHRRVKRPLVDGYLAATKVCAHSAPVLALILSVRVRLDPELRPPGQTRAAQAAEREAAALIPRGRRASAPAGGELFQHPAVRVLIDDWIRDWRRFPLDSPSSCRSSTKDRKSVV